MIEYYNEILSFHILAVFSWMTLLFYMPRLFVYHIENIDKKDFRDVVKIQEKKIYNIIGFPAMWATILSGFLLLYIQPSLLKQDWMIAKLIIIIFMIIYTFSLDYFRKRLEKNICNKNGQFFRAYNEIPTLLAIYIVVFVITKSIPIYFSISIFFIISFIIWKIATKKIK